MPDFAYICNNDFSLCNQMFAMSWAQTAAQAMLIITHAVAPGHVAQRCCAVQGTCQTKEGFAVAYKYPHCS